MGEILAVGSVVLILLVAGVVASLVVTAPDRKEKKRIATSISLESNHLAMYRVLTQLEGFERFASTPMFPTEEMRQEVRALLVAFDRMASGAVADGKVALTAPKTKTKEI